MKRQMLLAVFLLAACGKGEPVAVESDLTVLDATHLRLTLTTKESTPLLDRDALQVLIDGAKRSAIKQVGWFRGVSQAEPERSWVETTQQVTLTLSSPLAAGAEVRVLAPSFEERARFDPKRLNPAFHINGYGYDLKGDKQARVGLYLGSSGELPLSGGAFQVLESTTGESVLKGTLKPALEQGYRYQPAPNQHVWSADFSALGAGRYQLDVAGLGRSESFEVREGRAEQSARLYARGLYQQRCGQALTAPYTQQPRPACHLGEVAGLGRPVVGGHHDAADYGRYVFNAAMAAHLNLFAVECLPGFASVDDLGLPESGDQVPDLLQIALRDLEVVSAMQGEDGRFFSRLRPRDRAYDTEKTADQADPQKASPGNTVSTAVAVAVLAQAARCQEFRSRFPNQAKHYRQQALKGWKALDGWAFEKTDHHYGELFGDEDEKAWALVELYLLTGDVSFHRQLTERLERQKKSLRHWGWMAAHEGWGCAARSYVLARVPERPRDPAWEAVLSQELLAAGDVWLEASAGSAYGSTFPLQSKHHQTAGWFFPHDGSFDLLVADQLRTRDDIAAAIWSNWNYELGVNVKDMAFLTGAGKRWPKHLLHGRATPENPPWGIPVGSMISGPRGYPELAKVEWPELISGNQGMPLDQRWGDYPNVLSEATVVSQVRGLLSCLWLTQRSKTKGLRPPQTSKTPAP